MSAIDTNIENHEQWILDIIKDYEVTVPQKLEDLAREITNELKNGNYRSRTGNLRRSIQVKIIDYDLSIDMAAYGYYLSFGVQGGGKTGLNLSDDVESEFGVKRFSSKKRKAFGIKPRKFYPTDLEERLIEILTEE